MSTRSERKQNRIDRYNELARKAETKSIEAFEHSNSIVKCIPMGQPILVGHHSEKRHRRDLDKSWNAMGKSVQESEKAEYYRKKAAIFSRGDLTKTSHHFRTESSRQT